ncbi:uncharacterized protein LOC123681052 [Harmonia axyridis]|uniref:uncharacterized protein LOC123681052 n=1 Tax=Harmonia axyridis TaxID=115357 RepID=UPI001E277035|nr:uncharacterized protein LOC123681052 [Harmonia axyridis]
MASENDIFVDLNREDIAKLKEIYRGVEHARVVLPFLDVAETWFGGSELTITSPGDAWKKDGSIVAFMDFGVAAMFLFSLDDTFERICDGLLKTKRIDPGKPFYFLNVLDRSIDVILAVIQKMGRKIEINNENFLYTMNIDKTKSLKVECPPEVHVGRLKEEHAEQIDRVWPHRFEGSVNLVRAWLSKNVGFGLFLKENDQLVSWVMQGVWGHMNLLQTEEKYMRRGYANVMLMTITKYLAEQGQTPIATVLTRNSVSNNLFRKQGFETKAKSYFIFVSQRVL